MPGSNRNQGPIAMSSAARAIVCDAVMPPGEAAPLGDATIFVTAAELKELKEKVWELLQPYIRRADDPKRRPATARRVSYVHFGHLAREFSAKTQDEQNETEELRS